LIKEIISSERSTLLRKNDSSILLLEIKLSKFQNVFILNGDSFLIEEISNQILTVRPKDYYMIINTGDSSIEIHYNQDISRHKIIYDPYKYENAKKINLTLKLFVERFSIPKNYIDTLPKWYSFKFTYPDYNLIFVRPEFGISIQTHEYRDEFWEILEGNPIIINGNKVYYFVENGTKFKSQRNSFHSVINPNKEVDKFVENDIKRVFNPNQYR